MRSTGMDTVNVAELLLFLELNSPQKKKTLLLENIERAHFMLNIK